VHLINMKLPTPRFLSRQSRQHHLTQSGLPTKIPRGERERILKRLFVKIRNRTPLFWLLEPQDLRHFIPLQDAIFRASDTGIFPLTPKIQKGISGKPQLEPLDEKYSHVVA